MRGHQLYSHTRSKGIAKNAKTTQNAILEFVYFLLCLVIVLFIFGDEEPLLDITDLNFSHVIVFAVALLSVFFDNFVKGFFGQFMSTDRSTFIYAIFKSWAMLVYSVIIWFIFFFYSMTPLFTDDIDEVTMISAYKNTIVDEVISVSSILVLWFITTRINYTTIGNCASATYMFISFSIIGFLMYVFSAAVLSVLSTSSQQYGSSASHDRSRDVSAGSNLNANCASTSYSPYLGFDGFDWHTASSRNITFCFVDLASLLFLTIALVLVFFFAVLNAITLIVTLSPAKNWIQLQTNFIFLSSVSRFFLLQLAILSIASLTLFCFLELRLLVFYFF